MQEAEKAKAIFEAAADGIIVLNENLQVEMSNKAACKLWGYSHKALIGKHFNTLTTESTDAMLSEPKENALYEINILRNDKTILPLELSVSKTRLAEKSSTICVLRNIFPRKQLELHQDQEDEKSLNKLKSEFIANMSHELRTPLNAIIGYSEILQEDAQKIEQPPYYSTTLKKVTSSARHLLNLINNVLDLSKIEAGNIRLFLEDIKIESFIKESKTIITSLVEKNNNRFKLILSPHLKIMHTDTVMVRQSLLNLISNAGKFTQNGIITLKITPLLVDNKECVQFSVSDTGIGIRTEQLEKLFQLFFQIDATTTRKYDGTGLGLYLTKRFCEMLGGSVCVDSIENKGSIFSMILPARSISNSDEKTVTTCKKTKNGVKL